MRGSQTAAWRPERLNGGKGNGAWGNSSGESNEGIGSVAMCRGVTRTPEARCFATLLARFLSGFSGFRSRLHFYPRALLRRLEHGVANVLRFERIAEGRRARLACADRFEEISDLVRERLRVTDLQTGYPPVFHIRLIAIGDVNAAPAADDAFVAVIEILKPMQVVQIPADRRVLAINLERVGRLV